MSCISKKPRCDTAKIQFYVQSEKYKSRFTKDMKTMNIKENSQPGIEQIIRETTEENQSKTDWRKAWSTKHPILKTYQAGADIPHYAHQIRAMLTELRAIHGYSEQDAMLVPKDILAQEYMDNRQKKHGLPVFFVDFPLH